MAVRRAKRETTNYIPIYNGKVYNDINVFKFN